MSTSDKNISRRSIVAGAAWSAPVIAVAVAAPFSSASCIDQDLSGIYLNATSVPMGPDESGRTVHAMTITYSHDEGEGYFPEIRITEPKTRLDGSPNSITSVTTGEVTQGLEAIIVPGGTLEYYFTETDPNTVTPQASAVTIPQAGNCEQAISFMTSAA